MVRLPWHHYHVAYLAIEDTTDPVPDGYLDGQIFDTWGDARTFADANPTFNHDNVVLGCNSRGCM